jgi:uridylate kinase
LLVLVRQLSAALRQTRDSEGDSLGVFATLVGALQLARLVAGTELSNRILTAGADAARSLIRPCHDEVAS